MRERKIIRSYRGSRSVKFLIEFVHYIAYNALHNMQYSICGETRGGGGVSNVFLMYFD